MKTDLREPRLPRWHERLIYLGIALLLGTGVAWLLLDHFGQIEGDFGPEPHPALPWLLMAHGIAAYAFLVIVSALLPLHVRIGWVKQRNRWSGACLLLVGLLLSTTGLMLYYAAAERLRAQASLAHWTAGIALPLALGLHAALGKASRNKRLARASAGQASSDAKLGFE